MKKHLLSSLFIFFSLSLSGQNLELCGKNDEAELNSDEAAYLQQYLSDKLEGYDLSQKKVLFITGSAASRKGSKQAYFRDIRSWNAKNSRVVTGISFLNSEEKEASGGYDLILTYWVKWFTDRRKRSIIKKLAKNKEL